MFTIGLIISGFIVCLLFNANEKANREYLDYIQKHPDE